MEARVTKVARVSAGFSKSLARRQLRPNQDKVRSTTQQRGRTALVSLTLERRLTDRVAPELRRQVFDALADAPRNVVSLEGGLLKIDLREPRRELATSLRELRRARRLVAGDPDIMIAGLVAQSSTQAEMLESYPRLTPEMSSWRRFMPPPIPGRPRTQPWRGRNRCQDPAAARYHCGVVRFLIDECHHRPGFRGRTVGR
jgi:hypothetical protein